MYGTDRLSFLIDKRYQVSVTIIMYLRTRQTFDLEKLYQVIVYTLLWKLIRWCNIARLC